MSSVMVLCPNTAEVVYTGIEAEETTFTGLPNVISWLSCSACGGEHAWTIRKAWLADAGWNAAAKRIDATATTLKLVA